MVAQPAPAEARAADNYAAFSRGETLGGAAAGYAPVDAPEATLTAPATVSAYASFVPASSTDHEQYVAIASGGTLLRRRSGD